VISARARIRISTFLSIAAAIVLSLAAALLVLAPGMHPAPSPAAAAIDKTEHAQTIEAMRQRKRGRPMIAILALNEATEVTDFLVPYGVLQRADVADVTVVAEQASLEGIDNAVREAESAVRGGSKPLAVERLRELQALSERLIQILPLQRKAARVW
jgi:hypothetical protein